MISEIISNKELLVMGFTYEELEVKIKKFLVSQQEIMALWCTVISIFLMTRHSNATP
jgi:hypothetical protein